jgi:hypothetical protein
VQAVAISAISRNVRLQARLACRRRCRLLQAHETSTPLKLSLFCVCAFQPDSCKLVKFEYSATQYSSSTLCLCSSLLHLELGVNIDNGDSPFVSRSRICVCVFVVTSAAAAANARRSSSSSSSNHQSMSTSYRAATSMHCDQLLMYVHVMFLARCADSCRFDLL